LLRSSRRLDAVKARPAGARVVGKKASHG
jgi:hypothetical protein